jgi:hypothetical protein
VLQCCRNAVLRFKKIGLENQWKKLQINPLTTCASRITIEIELQVTSCGLHVTKCRPVGSGMRYLEFFIKM